LISICGIHGGLVVENLQGELAFGEFDLGVGVLHGRLVVDLDGDPADRDELPS